MAENHILTAQELDWIYAAKEVVDEETSRITRMHTRNYMITGGGIVAAGMGVIGLAWNGNLDPALMHMEEFWNAPRLERWGILKQLIKTGPSSFTSMAGILGGLVVLLGAALSEIYGWTKPYNRTIYGLDFPGFTRLQTHQKTSLPVRNLTSDEAAWMEKVKAAAKKYPQLGQAIELQIQKNRAALQRPAP